MEGLITYLLLTILYQNIFALRIIAVIFDLERICFVLVYISLHMKGK